MAGAITDRLIKIDRVSRRGGYVIDILRLCDQRGTLTLPSDKVLRPKATKFVRVSFSNSRP